MPVRHEDLRSLVQSGGVFTAADLLEKLSTILTDSQKQQLVTVLAAANKGAVRPGDLITADLMSQVLADIADLQLAVATLQGGGVTTSKAPVLISRDPTGDVEVGSKLTLLGISFRASGSTNTVMLGSVAINAFLVEDDTRISFQVPDSFTGLPRDMSVFVKNAKGPSQSLAVRVLPPTPVQGGQVVILDQTGALGQIGIGTTYGLKWLIDSQTLLPVAYRWRLVFTNLVGGASAQAWSDSTVFVPVGPTEIVAGSPLLVTASVTVPSGARSADISLLVEKTSGSFSKPSSPLRLEVGAMAVISDTRALVSLKTIPPLNPVNPLEPNPVRAANIVLSDGTSLSGVQIKYGATGKIPCNMHVTSDTAAAGSYAYSVQIETPGALWATPSVTPTRSAQTVNSDRAITVTVTNTDASSSVAFTYLVVIATHTPTGSATPDFLSFIRIPIQGTNF